MRLLLLFRSVLAGIY